MRKFLISITLLSAVIYASWYYHYGYLVGTNAVEAVDILIKREHLVISPRDEGEIYTSCDRIDEIYLIPDSYISLIVIEVNNKCIIESVRMGWRK